MALLLTFAAQAKVVENPSVGMSKESFVTLEKVELTESETRLQFHVRIRAGFQIFIPRDTYIQPLGGTKHTVKGAEDVLLGEWVAIPESGDIRYTLTFPPIDQKTERLDYSEGNGSGAWFIYDVQLSGQKKKEQLPEEIYGKWRNPQTGALELCLFDTVAVYKNNLWKYEHLKFKKGKGTVRLDANGEAMELKLTVDQKNLKVTDTDGNVKVYDRNRGVKTSEDKEVSLPVLSSDSATYSGYLYKYNPRCGVNTMQFLVNNILTGDQNEYTIDIQPNGYFSITVPLHYPHQVFLKNSFFQPSMLYLEPGKELFHVISFDFPRKKTLEYMGELASINNELSSLKSLVSMKYQDVRKNILDMSPKDYVAYVQTFWDADKQTLKEKYEGGQMSEKAYQLKQIELDYHYAEEMLSYEMNYRSEYRRKHKLDSRAKFDVDSLQPEYLPFLTHEFANNELALTTNSYYSFINRLKYASFIGRKPITIRPTTGIEEYLNDHPDITDYQLKIVDFLNYQDSVNKLPENRAFWDTYSEDLTSFRKTYTAEWKSLADSTATDPSFWEVMNYLKENGKEIDEKEEIAVNALKGFWEQETHKRLNYMKLEISQDSITAFYQLLQPYRDFYFKKVYNARRIEGLYNSFNIEPGLATDIMFSQDICRDVVEQLNPLSADAYQLVKQEIHTPFIEAYVQQANEQSIEKIAWLKAHKPDNVREVPDVSNEELFASMMENYKGKVVYVDFWATWCGPCRSGIKRIAPLKDEMEGKEVAFVYITGPSSPEGTWDTMISEIKGEHYRVNKEQWKFLCDTYKVTGIPHYMLVDKNGNIVDTDLERMQNSQLKELLEETMRKQDVGQK